MKRCKCEHWETCQVCYPQWFDEQGHRKPVEAPPSREELLSRIKELEADAARYRWLRDNKAQNNTHCWHFQNGPIIPGLLTLDTAIDAALKAASILDSSFPHNT